MSNIVQSVKQLVSPKSIRKSLSPERRRRRSSQKEQNAKSIEEDIAVPALGHQSGYDYAKAVGVDSSSQAMPAHSTHPPREPPGSLLSDSAPGAAGTTEPSGQRVGAHTSGVIDEDAGAVDRPVCDLVSAVSREREERIARQVDKLADGRGRGS